LGLLFPTEWAKKIMFQTTTPATFDDTARAYLPSPAPCSVDRAWPNPFAAGSGPKASGQVLLAAA